MRVDWSATIGLGHVQRCLSLMDALARVGFEGLFLAGPQVADRTDLVQERGHELVQLAGIAAQPVTTRRSERGVEALFATVEQVADAAATVAALSGQHSPKAVIVDHYGLDSTWETHVQQDLCVPLVAIDGLANRSHTADLLIDPTYVLDDTERWDQLASPDTRLLLGPQYAPIAPQFQAQLERRPDRHGYIRRVLVSFGGSDPNGLTEVAIDAIEELGAESLTVDVVVGAGHADPVAIEQRCSRMPHATFHHATSRMAELMVAADLAIGSGGITTYERAFLGLPALVVVAATNQQQQVVEAERAGALLCLGAAVDVEAADIAMALAELLAHPQRVRKMGLASRKMMGDTHIPGSIRVAKEITALLT